MSYISVILTFWLLFVPINSFASNDLQTTETSRDDYSSPEKRPADLNIKIDDIDLGLIIAVRENDLDEVNSAIAAGANVNIAGEDGWTPLMFAAITGKYEIAKALLSAKANVNVTAKKGGTPLSLAILKGDEKMAKLLIEAGADFEKSIGQGLTPLIFAANRGDKKLVELLLNNGANPEKKGDNGTTALNEAASIGNLEIVTLLLKQGANPNEIGYKGFTPLISASFGGHENVVKALLAEGADAAYKTKDGVSALQAAGASKNTNLIKRFSEGRPDKIFLAAAYGIPEIIDQKSVTKRQVNKKNSDNITLIMMAAINNHTEVVKSLIKKGANVNIRDKNKNTPLIAAALNGNLQMVKALVEAGAKTNYKNKEKLTAYHVARQKQHKAVSNYLLEQDPKAVEKSLALNRNDKVLIQYGLNEAKQNAGKPDGVFGKKTRAAISLHQSENNLPETGYLTSEQSLDLMKQGMTARNIARKNAAERQLRQAQNNQQRLYNQAVTESKKRTLTLRFRSLYRYIVYLKFHSQHRKGFVWPSPTTSWPLKDSKFHTYKLGCAPGEKICYGAFSGKYSWGAGRYGRLGCKGCCWTCGSKGTMTLR